jgi:hypothetical protein
MVSTGRWVACSSSAPLIRYGLTMINSSSLTAVFKVAAQRAVRLGDHGRGHPGFEAHTPLTHIAAFSPLTQSTLRKFRPTRGKGGEFRWLRIRLGVFRLVDNDLRSVEPSVEFVGPCGPRRIGIVNDGLISHE